MDDSQGCSGGGAGGHQGELGEHRFDILVLQDLFTAGYHSAAYDRLDECGLDFNHRSGKKRGKEIPLSQ